MALSTFFKGLGETTTARRNQRLFTGCALQALESRVFLTATPSPLSQTIAFGGPATGGGGHPSSLVMDASGNVFGTTLVGGTNNYGTIFEIPAGTTSVITLATFPGGTGGFSPMGNLVLEGGNLFGTTSSGGAFDRGSLFELNLTTNALTTLASFQGGINGADPTSGIASDGNGHFFGTTFGASQQNSTIFEYTLATGSLQTIVSLPIHQRIDTGVAINPATGLVEIANAATINGVLTGTIFASTSASGANNHGSLISYTLGSGATTFNTIASFDGTHGNGPLGSLLYVANADAAGDPGLVGLASGGGGQGIGSVFDAPLTVANGAFTSTLTSLGSLKGPTGGRPNGNLLLVDSTNSATNSLLGNTLYGVTAAGGGNGFGSVFKITNATPSRTPVAIPPFVKSAFSQTTGTNPSGGLVIEPNGTLIGTTYRRGQFNFGSIFFLPPTAPVNSGAKLAFTSLPTTGTAGTPLGATTANPDGALQVKIEDAAGHVITTANGNVTLQVATQGTTIAPVTVAAVNGVATFSNITLTRSGSYTFLATAGTTAAQSQSVTISAAAASKLAIATQPTVGTTGRTSPIVVNVEDAFGNTVTTDKSKVTLSLASGPGPLAGTTTVTAKKGVATFSALRLASPGTYTLAANDAALTAATSSPFTLGAPATQLVITQQPQDGIVGHALTTGEGFTVAVTLLDAAGNVATADSSVVTLILATHPGAARLTGPTTARVINGVATFTSLQLFTAGTYSLRAADGTLSVTSTSFNVAATT